MVKFIRFSKSWDLSIFFIKSHKRGKLLASRMAILGSLGIFVGESAWALVWPIPDRQDGGTPCSVNQQSSASVKSHGKVHLLITSLSFNILPPSLTRSPSKCIHPP